MVGRFGKRTAERDATLLYLVALSPPRDAPDLINEREIYI